MSERIRKSNFSAIYDAEVGVSIGRRKLIGLPDVLAELVVVSSISAIGITGVIAVKEIQRRIRRPKDGSF